MRVTLEARVYYQQHIMPRVVYDTRTRLLFMLRQRAFVAGARYVRIAAQSAAARHAATTWRR